MGGAAGARIRSARNARSSPSAGVHSGRVLALATRRAQARRTVERAPRRQRRRWRDCASGAAAFRSPRRATSAVCSLEASAEAHKKSGSPTGLLVSELKTPGEGLGRFVGRKQQLKRIGEILSLASRRRVFVITLRGSQGAGKTRLLYETERRLKKGEYKVAFYMGTCPPSGASIPLSGITSLLQVLCGIKEGDPEERILEVEPRLTGARAARRRGNGLTLSARRLQEDRFQSERAESGVCADGDEPFLRSASRFCGTTRKLSTRNRWR